MTQSPAPESLPHLYALVPCAGTGERSGAQGPKQYALLAGRSLVAHTLAALAQVTRLTQTLVVLSPSDREFETLECAVSDPPHAGVYGDVVSGPSRGR